VELRAIPAGALHVTLAFLGWRPEAEADAVAAAAFGAIGGLRAPRLSADVVRALPRRAPRLFALGLADDGGRADALHSAVAGALERAEVYEAEARPFWPHVTLARVRRGTRAGRLPDLPPPDQPFEATELTLYRSHLHRGGARYEPLARRVLG
jgi:2'-5' RNA ligase